MNWKLRVVLDAFRSTPGIWYKTRWLGPSDAFAFTTKNSVLLLDLHPADEKHPTESLTGWRVFHETCSELRALTGSSKSGSVHSHYLHVLAANCSAPDGLTEEMAPQLSTMVLSSDIRADAMAWAACKLLYVSRRPPLCQDAMRYDGATNVRAERELRALLDVIGKSVPLSRVVCVGGVEIDQQPDQQEPLRWIFGCASPDVPGNTLQTDKARLTADEIDVLGMRFIFPNGGSTALNLSCSGFLYNVLILVDVVLLVMHAWSSVELLERLILPPLLRTPTKQEMRDLSPVAILSAVSALLSWLLLLPHTAVWELSGDETSFSFAWIHTLLSGLRVWPFAFDSTTKHDMEAQRVVDNAAFPGHSAISNAFEDRMHMLPARAHNSVLWMIYTPLIELLLLSLLLPMEAPSLDSHPHRQQWLGTNAFRWKNYWTCRLIENIVRSGGIGGLEKTVGDEQFLWSVQYLSHGVLLENDRFLSTRRGFYRVLPMQERMDPCMGQQREKHLARRPTGLQSVGDTPQTSSKETRLFERIANHPLHQTTQTATP
ncbi:hypothetical protein GQ600_15543 [Phytophthora cactorum]|nr:hypothetical protein GQ600_15543 [Phytophthora cactorum]